MFKQKLTVKELYEYAKEHGIENNTIIIADDRTSENGDDGVIIESKKDTVILYSGLVRL